MDRKLLQFIQILTIQNQSVFIIVQILFILRDQNKSQHKLISSMLRLLNTHSRYFKILTKQQATTRQSLIKKQSIEYSFHINLNPGKTYNGLMEMKFDFKPQQQTTDTQLDFQGKRVKMLYVNGQIVETKYNAQKGKIELPQRFLQRQNNYISVSYENEYDMDGSGCVSFTDVDKKQYLYTQFQPYFANRVFPLFDQPDLKAKMKLAVSYPHQWQTAISNELIQNEHNFTTQDKRSFFSIHSKFMSPKLPEKYTALRQKLLQEYMEIIPNTYKLTTFRQTALLPSYLYCFVVGPYKKFICNNTYNNLPMSLYCIQSLEPQLTRLRPYIEQMTNKSFAFFQQYFRCPYPFTKYDQVFAHQYKWGAMENAGVVTLNDLYLFKDRVSNEKMLSFGNTIVHQLAHHWFGNLVTMKWWDDLWLNESFAEYISHFCLQKIKSDIKTLDYESAMLSFYIRKGWGYNEDELITTHPITSEVLNTHVAQSIFDGITYSKGAATMKQLMYLIGEENFSKAIGEYFNKYKFKNTELDDLLQCIEKYFPQMKGWRQMWLEKAGGNLLTCEWDKDSKTLTVRQSCVREQHPTLRIHKINIAYIQKNGKITKQQVTILDKAEQTFTIPSGIKPVAILLNYEDLTFCKISIDSLSFEYFQSSLHEIKDSLTRAMIWRTLFEMVRDARMTSQQYMQFIVKNLKNEQSDTIVEEQLGNLAISLTQYTPQRHRQSLFSQVYTFLKTYLTQLQKSKENRITILKDKLIVFAYSQPHKREILSWFEQILPQLNAHQMLKLNKSQKGKALLKFFSAKDICSKEKEKAFAALQKLDNSDMMMKRKLSCDVMLETSEEKLFEVYNKLLKMQHITSTSNYVYTIQGLNNPIHKQFIKHKLSNNYYKDLRSMLEQTPSTINLKDDYKEEFMTYMDPIGDDTAEDLVKKREQLEKIGAKNDKLRILLLKKIDNLKRKEKCYKFYQATGEKL